MSTVSATTFFGGAVPPPPTTTPDVAPGPHPLDGLGASERIKADFLKRAQNDKSINQSNQSLPSKILQNLGQGAGFLTDIPSDVVKSVLPQPVKDVVKAGVQAVAQTAPVQAVAAKYAAFKAAHPEAAANLEATGLIASILPVGKAAAVGGELAGEAAVKGAGVAAEAAGNAVAVTGRATSGVGESLYKTAITPTVEEAKRIQSFNAKVPFFDRVSNQLTGATPAISEPATRADTALKAGILGRNADIGVQATRQADKLYSGTIAPAVEASPVRITKEQLFAPLKERIAAEVDPTRRAGLQAAFDSLKNDYASVSDYSLKDAQALKRSLAKFTPTKIFKGQDVANDMRTLQADMAGAIRHITYDALGDKNIKQAYLDYGNLTELKKLGVKALTDASSKGGFGSFWSGAWDKATVPVKTVGGQVLYRVGNKLEFLGEKGLKTFGQFLQKRGYQKP